jgi:chemotaxis regulatin CheY-phosphate phosphatase CheZ
MDDNTNIKDRLRLIASMTSGDVSATIIKAVEEIDLLEKRIGDASILMADWDGYYNPETKQGNAVELANLIYESFTILQGRGWNDKAEADAQNEHFRTNHK